MPNIAIYSPERMGLQPNERATDALAQQARTVGGFYDRAASSTRQLGQEYSSAIRMVGSVMDDIVSAKEISSGGKAYAEVQRDLSKAWDDTAQKADPNDSGVAQRFTSEVMEPALEKLTGGFLTERGRNFIQARGQSLREHMFTKTTADMSTLAGIALKTNLVESLNAFSSTVKQDPSSLDTVMESFRAQVESLTDSSPNLRGVEAQKARFTAAQGGLEKIVQTAVNAAIELTPEAGLRMARDPKYSRYVSGDDITKFEKEAKSVIRERRQDIQWAQHQQDRAAKKASDEVQMDMELKILSGDPSVTLKGIRDDQTLTPDSKRMLGRVLMREMKPATAAVVSRANTAKLMERIIADEGDPTRISDTRPLDEAFVREEISKEDWKFLKDRVNDPDGDGTQARFNEFLRTYKKSISKPNSFGVSTPEDEQRAYFFYNDAMAKFKQYKKEGKNPLDLVNPAKPDFLGSPASLSQYTQTLEQQLTARTKALSKPAATPDKLDPPPIPNARKDRSGYWNYQQFDPATQSMRWVRVPGTTVAPPNPVPTGR